MPVGGGTTAKGTEAGIREGVEPGEGVVDALTGAEGTEDANGCDSTRAVA